MSKGMDQWKKTSLSKVKDKYVFPIKEDSALEVWEHKEDPAVVVLFNYYRIGSSGYEAECNIMTGSKSMKTISLLKSKQKNRVKDVAKQFMRNYPQSLKNETSPVGNIFNQDFLPGL